MGTTYFSTTSCSLITVESKSLTSSLMQFEIFQFGLYPQKGKLIFKFSALGKKRGRRRRKENQRGVPGHQLAILIEECSMQCRFGGWLRLSYGNYNCARRWWHFNFFWISLGPSEYVISDRDSGQTTVTLTISIFFLEGTCFLPF